MEEMIVTGVKMGGHSCRRYDMVAGQLGGCGTLSNI